MTKGDIPPEQMATLNHVDIADQPIIGMNDIIRYNAQTHELKLTVTAFDRIAQLEVPVQGKSFMVCVDKNPIYFGAFWTSISSISFDGVTIWKPFSSQEPKVITLELGYRSSSFYGSEDPRNNPEVINSFEQAGKLINKLSITSVDELSHSTAVYELYSWSTDGQWNFTLITGTDRNKTLGEITSNDDFISEAGRVQIHLVGVDEIKAVLNKVPQKEGIFWLAGPRDQTPQASIIFQLPPWSIIDDVKEYAVGLGLNFIVTTH